MTQQPKPGDKREFAIWQWFIAIAMILIFASLVVTSKYESACKQQKRQDESNRASVPIPLIQKENNDPKNYAQECKEEAPWWEKLVAWPDGITALALILTLAAIAAQASLMKEHAGAFEEVAEAAKNNAAAALEQSKIAIRSERPWLLFEQITTKDTAIGNHGQGVWPRINEFCSTLVNYGKTPARVICYSLRFEISENSTSPPHPEIFDLDDFVVNPHIIPQGDKRPDCIKLEPPYSGGEHQAVTGGRRFLWAYGAVRYIDVHGEQYETRICYRSNPYTLWGTGQKITFRLDGPPEYNRAT